MSRCPELPRPAFRLALLALLAFSYYRIGLSATSFFDIGAHIGSYIALHDARSRCRRLLLFNCMARADIRIRVRPGVIRIRIGETAVRTVIRITAPDQHLSSQSPSTYHLHLSAFNPLHTIFLMPGKWYREGWKMDYHEQERCSSPYDFKDLLLVIQPPAEHRT